jgi:hypothetical protein
VGLDIQGDGGVHRYAAGTLSVDSCQAEGGPVPPPCPSLGDNWLFGLLPCGLRSPCGINLCGKGDSGSNHIKRYAKGLKKAAEQRIPLGSYLWSVATGDFNSDGNVDLAMSNNIGAFVTVLLGKGDGTFQPQVRYDATESNGIVAADFSNDGMPDLAIAGHLIGEQLNVLINEGNGVFSSPVGSGVLMQPAEIRGADFNNDGKMDIVAPDRVSGSGMFDVGETVSVFLGKGDGTFNDGVKYGCAKAPGPVITRDLNSDGKVDIAVGGVTGLDGYGRVSVLLGKGNGTFDPEVRYNVGYNPSAMACADLNSDGNVDLAVCNFYWPDDISYLSLSVLMGRGDGTFDPEMRYELGEGDARSVTSLDWNLDGKMDLAIPRIHTPQGENDGLLILLGNGDGAFLGQLEYTVGDFPTGVASSDLNKDGKSDLVVVNHDSFDLSIFLNDNDPDKPITVTPPPVTATPTPRPPLEVNVSSKEVPAGDSFQMGIQVNQEIRDGVRYDGYVAVILQNGRKYTRQSCGKWAKGVKPMVENVGVIKPLQKTLLNLPKVPLKRVGTYKFIAAFVPHGRKPSPANAVYMDIEEVVVVSNGQVSPAAHTEKDATFLSLLYARLF